MARIKKVCTIENARFNYLLRVDDQVIALISCQDAAYFAQHYKKLGYKIRRTNTSHHPLDIRGVDEVLIHRPDKNK